MVGDNSPELDVETGLPLTVVEKVTAESGVRQIKYGSVDSGYFKKDCGCLPRGHGGGN